MFFLLVLDAVLVVNVDLPHPDVYYARNRLHDGNNLNFVSYEDLDCYKLYNNEQYGLIVAFFQGQFYNA